MILVLFLILGVDHQIPSGTSSGYKLLKAQGELYSHNGTSDYALATAGGNGQCLVSDNTTTTGIKWASCSGSAGYTTVQDEGSGLTARSTIDFTGTGVTCTDTGAKTSCSISSGSGAPTTSTYITQTCDATLSNEQCMSALGTGLVISTTTTGVQSIYAGGSCGANTFVTSTNASGALTCTQPGFSNISGSVTDAQVPNNITVDLATLATSASALASDPSDCGAGQYAHTIAANGNLTCASIGFGELTGTVTDAQVPNTITIDTATALAVNPTACGANLFVTDTAANGTLTCTQPAFSNLSGAATDAQVPDNITVTLAATATALAADPADCGANTYATTIAASGALTCAQVSLSAGVTGTLPVANGGGGLTVLAAPVAVAVNATYVTVFSVTPGVSKTNMLSFHIFHAASITTTGVQFRVSSADTGNVGTCHFAHFGVSGAAASATTVEMDMIAIAAAPADDGASAAGATTINRVDVDCNFASDGTPGAVLLEAQLETGTTSINIFAGSSYTLYSI